MKKRLIEAVWVIGTLAVVVGLTWLQIDVWNECRSTNSFWYCMRVLSK